MLFSDISFRSVFLFVPHKHAQRQTHRGSRSLCPDGIWGSVPWQSAAVTAEAVKCESSHCPGSMDLPLLLSPESAHSLSMSPLTVCLFLPFYSMSAHSLSPHPLLPVFSSVNLVYDLFCNPNGNHYTTTERRHNQKSQNSLITNDN